MAFSDILKQVIAAQNAEKAASQQTMQKATFTVGGTPTAKSVALSYYKQLEPSSRGTYQPTPGSQAFVFGPEGGYKQEGVYKNLGDVRATYTSGHSDTGEKTVHEGTLYMSDLGAWQLIDKNKRLIMSGSASSPLPKLEQIGGSSGISADTSAGGSPGEKTKITQEPDQGTNIFRSENPFDLSQGESVWNPAATKINANATPTATDTTKPQSQQQSASVFNLTRNKWGLPDVSSMFKSKTQRYGEYEVEGDKITNTLTGQVGTISGGNITWGAAPASSQRSSSGANHQPTTRYPYATGYSAESPYRSSIYLPGGGNTTKIGTTTLPFTLGSFGAKQSKRVQKKKPATHNQKKKIPSLFPEISPYADVDYTVLGSGVIGKTRLQKPLIQKKSKNVAVTKNALWSGLTFGNKSNKPMIKLPSEKKHVFSKRDEEEYGSAWESVLSRKTAKKGRK